MIKELRNYTWQKTKDGKAIDVPIDAFNHSIDATRYFMTSQVTKPTGKYRGGVI
jgi:phage terminase large subunit